MAADWKGLPRPPLPNCFDGMRKLPPTSVICIDIFVCARGGAILPLARYGFLLRCKLLLLENFSLTELREKLWSLVISRMLLRSFVERYRWSPPPICALFLAATNVTFEPFPWIVCRVAAYLRIEVAVSETPWPFLA